MSNFSAVLIVIIIIMIYTYSVMTSTPNMKLVRYKTLRKEKRFKTGDIILFHAVDHCYSLLIGEYYGHMGIVWVDPVSNIPYIFEAVYIKGLNIEEDQNKNGIFLSPLDNRFGKYRGYMIYRELETPIDKKITDDFKGFIDFCIDNMKYDINFIPISICHLMGHKCNEYTNCAEIVFLSLIKLGLLPPDAYDWTICNYLSFIISRKEYVDNRYLEDVCMIDHPF